MSPFPTSEFYMFDMPALRETRWHARAIAIAGLVFALPLGAQNSASSNGSS